MKALILDNEIVDIVKVEFPVSELMTWVDFPEGSDFKHGDYYRDGKFEKKIEELPEINNTPVLPYDGVIEILKSLFEDVKSKNISKAPKLEEALTKYEVYL